MTPLAARLAKQLTLSVQDRDPYWDLNSERLRQALNDIHCFEVTEAMPMLHELGKSLASRFGHPMTSDEVSPEQSEFIGNLVFLPAPKTWIEWRHPAVWRLGILLEERGEVALVTFFTEDCATPMGYISLKSDDWHVPKFRGGGAPIDSRYLNFHREHGADTSKIPEEILSCAHFWLVLINSPKIIGRRQVMPNGGLERKLVKKFGAGKFPLHAWTEIRLQVAKPVEIDDGEPHEAHLTGRRALHFCRKHIRIRLGKLEYVSAHWRGDPALGIKQSRYRLTA